MANLLLIALQLLTAVPPRTPPNADQPSVVVLQGVVSSARRLSPLRILYGGAPFGQISTAAAGQWRTALPGQEHCRWAAPRLAGIADAAIAFRAHEGGGGRSPGGWHSDRGRRTRSALRRERATQPTSRSGPGNELFKTASQEKGGTKGTTSAGSRVGDTRSTRRRTA